MRTWLQTLGYQSVEGTHRRFHVRRRALGLALAAVGFALPSQQRIVEELHHALAAESVSVDTRLELLARRTRAALSDNLERALGSAREWERFAREHNRPGHVAWAAACEGVAELGRAGAKAANDCLERSEQGNSPDAGIALVVDGWCRIFQARILERLARVGQSARRLREAVERAEQAYASDQRGSSELLVCALLDREQKFRVASVAYDPDPDLQRIEQLLATIDDPHSALRLRTVRAYWRHQHRGRESRARDELRAVLDSARELGDRDVQYEALLQLYSYEARVDAWAAAHEHARRQIEVARAHSNRRFEARIFDRVAWSSIYLGKPASEVGEAYDHAMGIAEELQLPYLMFEVYGTGRTLATMRRDADLLLHVSLRLREIASDPQIGSGAQEQTMARAILGEMRDALVTESEESASDAAALTAARAESDRRLNRYRWFALALVSLLAIVVSLLAALFFVGKRRAERDHRKLQAQSEKAQLLERHITQLERLDSLGMLAAGVAHDFNNLLCSIAGHAELLTDPKIVDRLRSIQAIRQSAERGSALCSRLLDYAKPVPRNPEVVDLGRIVRETQPLLDISGIQSMPTEVELSDDHVHARVDRTGFEQVLVNLATNAHDPQVGATRVQVRIFRSTQAERPAGSWFGTLANAPEYAVLEVSDNGRGIDKKQVRRVFDPFFTTKFEGRGLGLSAAYGIVKSHQGAIHVDSQPDRGTTFSVFLPTARPDASSNPDRESTAPRPEPSSRNVLAIDDEPSILTFIATALARGPHSVQTAQTKTETIRLLAKLGDRLDLVLLDLSLPDVDGTELLEHIHSSYPELEIVIMSGHGQEFITDRIAGYPIARVLVKPFDANQLLDCLQSSGAIGG